MLYMFAELLEFSPAVAEWLGLRRARRILKAMTLGAVIFGVTRHALWSMSIVLVTLNGLTIGTGQVLGQIVLCLVLSSSVTPWHAEIYPRALGRW